MKRGNRWLKGYVEEKWKMRKLIRELRGKVSKAQAEGEHSWSEPTAAVRLGKKSRTRDLG